MKFLRKFIQLPGDEKLLLFEAVVLLFFSKVFLLFPFRYCIRRLRPEAEMRGTPDPLMLTKIHDAVARANRLALWKNVCLVKTFAARFMLQRRNIGSVMYLGLQLKNGKELVAHAWLVSAEMFITPKGKSDYKEIFSI